VRAGTLKSCQLEERRGRKVEKEPAETCASSSPEEWRDYQLEEQRLVAEGADQVINEKNEEVVKWQDWLKNEEIISRRNGDLVKWQD
jgi:hypothetical protein